MTVRAVHKEGAGTARAELKARRPGRGWRAFGVPGRGAPCTSSREGHGPGPGISWVPGSLAASRPTAGPRIVN